MALREQIAKDTQEIGRLTKLQLLSLHTNNLQEIPPEISRLTNLQQLWLYNNNLREIPREICGLKLEYLWIYSKNMCVLYKLIFYASCENKTKCQLQNIYLPICELL